MNAPHVRLSDSEGGAFFLDKFQNVVREFDQTEHRLQLSELLKAKVDTPAFRVSDDPVKYLRTGLDRLHASQALVQGKRNVVVSPQRCPGWLCCLLPCLDSTPKMTAYHSHLAESTTVLRGGKKFLLASDDLVVGDVIFLFAGDIVPADCRIVEDTGKQALQFNVSVLCGIVDGSQTIIANGSVQSTSDSVVESENICRAGSLVHSGSCQCIVVSVGDNLLWSRLIKSNRWITPR